MNADKECPTYELVANLLGNVGWQGINDAQWDRLRDAIPKLTRLLAAAPSSPDAQGTKYTNACEVLSRLLNGLKQEFPDIPDCDSDNVENDVLMGLSSYIANLKEAPSPPAAVGRLLTEDSSPAYMHEGTVCIDWDSDPKRQFSIGIKPDGSVFYAVYLDGEKLVGDAFGEDFKTAVYRWSHPQPLDITPTSQPHASAESVAIYQYYSHCDDAWRDVSQQVYETYSHGKGVKYRILYADHPAPSLTPEQSQAVAELDDIRRQFEGGSHVLIECSDYDRIRLILRPLLGPKP